MPRQADHALLEMALVGYQARHAELAAAMTEIRKKLGPGRRSASANGSGTKSTPSGNRRSMSAAARKSIAAAQRKRWAAYRAAKAAK